MMKTIDINRFEEFFAKDNYHLLKNHLYNYLLRKEAVENALINESLDRVLEVGSGISPMITCVNRVVYMDLSLTAVQALRGTGGKGWYVVADCTHLPFKRNTFSHTICSEVLEHIEDDTLALCEMSRVLKPSGRMVVTFPHGKFYFAVDDRLVNHCRRYDIAEMKKKLNACDFTPTLTQKVLGPLEKITMILAAACYLLTLEIGKALPKSDTMQTSKVKKPVNVFVTMFKWVNRAYAKLVWLDAKMMPQCFSTVLLMKCSRLNIKISELGC